MKRTLILMFISWSMTFSQGYQISGRILNEENAEPIPYVSIRIVGTNQGTTSNLEGNFSLSVQGERQKLFFTAVGFKRKEFLLNSTQNTTLKIEMVPEPIRMLEIVVGSTEDPAYRIIRKAIKRKEENHSGLKSLEFDFFSKNIMLSAGNVAMVAEKFSTGYYQIGKPEKVIAHSIHATENEKKNAAKFNQNILEKTFVDFSDDNLFILSNKVFLPLAKNAFDWYDYKLIMVKQNANVHDCYIEVIPQSSIQPLLKGMLVIEDSTFSIRKVDLKNNEGLRFPFVNDLKLSFIQSSDRFDKYWLPTSFKVEASLKLNFSGLIGFDEIAMNQDYVFNSYRINTQIPDSIYKIQTALESDTAAAKKENTYFVTELNRMQIDSLRPIPLTTSEVNAYKELDSSKTIQTQIKFTGVFGGIAERAAKEDQESKTGKSGFWKYLGILNSFLNFSNNRVNGILLGAKYSFLLFNNYLRINPAIGYAIKRKEWETNLSLRISPGTGFLNSIELFAFNKAEQWQSLNPYPDLMNSISVLTGFEDQFNYYLSRGVSLGLNSIISPRLSISTKFTYEYQNSLPIVSYTSILRSSRDVRLNPSIVEGNDNRLSINFTWGNNPQSYKPILENGLIAQFDFSNPTFASKFNYKRMRVISQVTTKTLYGELFSAPYFTLGIEGGMITGEYGPQHLFTPNSALGVYSPFLSFKALSPYQFVGDKMVGFHAEHNWRSVPFQALGITFLSDLFIDFTTGASVLKSWNESGYLMNASQDKTYWETYLSFGRIFGMGRIDFCYCSQKNFVVRVGLATLL